MTPIGAGPILMRRAPRRAEPMGYRATRGFSLVEIVVAMFILTFTLTAILPMLKFNMRSNTQARSYGTANYLAQQQLERVFAWPVYETTTVESVSRPGINTGNTELFTTKVVRVPPDKIPYTVTSELYHNGYTQTCQPTLFGVSGGSRNVDDGDLNTGNYSPLLQGDCSSGQYRGEDFKVVRVKVSWSDIFGTHEIQRHGYVARF
ncbi:prepilin-type N-terminal cleavage/methylation domain-containing protein [bacterium]|nr:prepilin-type N-terminal cleavage/methylation domain-containing protein [bacterium]